MNVNKDTKIFISIASTPGNIGAKFYNKYFKKKKINGIYIPIKITDNCKDVITSIKKLGISGCSVSMPHKSKIIKFLKYVEKDAKKINSVNTIVNKNGNLFGYNSDIYSVNKIISDLKIEKKSKILIIGSGSMSKTFYNVLNKTKKYNIFLTNRKNKKILNIKSKNMIKWNKKKDFEFDILVNSTPLGMVKHKSFPVRSFNFNSCKTIIDVVAIPKKTNLSIYSRKNKINYISGVKISELQAKKQFEYYTGIKI